MTVSVRQFVRQEPLALPAGTTLLEAAKVMQERQAEDALVMDYGVLRGIVTQRDVTVRADAEGRDPSCTSLAEVCRRALLSVRPDDSAQKALALMRQQGVSRLADIDDEGTAGIISRAQLIQAEDHAPA